MADDCEIRPLAEGDVGPVAALARDIWQAAYLELIGQGQIDYMLAQRYGAERMRAELAMPGVWWRQLTIGGKLAGFSSCHLDTQQGELKLDKLYVHPHYQRLGLGGRLIADAEALARQQECGHLVLCVNKHNAQAIAAYRKHGFSVRESICMDIGGGYVMDDYLMEKPITSEKAHI